MMNIGESLQVALQHHNSGNLAEAERIYRQILAVDPQHADSLHLLGVIAHQAGHSGTAPELIRRAIALNPSVPEYYNNLGNVLKESGSGAEAAACFQRAAALRPGFVDAHYNLGNLYAKEERHAEAIECYRTALGLRPQHSASLVNLGNALRSLGRIPEALKCYAQVPANDPQFAEVRWNGAIAHLLAGNFARGWDEYESRWDLERARSRRRSFSKPQWDGADISGSTILLHAEQGFGDTIQFIRYARLTAALGARVVVECAAPLTRIVGSAEGVAGVATAGGALPEFDVHSPLLSLPRIFGTRLHSVPAAVPYLEADSKLVRGWKSRFKSRRAGLKVGLAWAGGTSDPKRDCALAALAPLAAVPGTVFVSLQKGEAAAQASSPPARMRLIDWSDELNDVADTAALISALDLVISVDTSIPHLAGALGKPVWTLLRFAPDWRWLLDRDDSPWYPSMRLFRQDQPGSWRGAIARAADGLARLAGVQPALRTTR